MNILASFLFDIFLLFIGYGFARLQLRGRFVLAEEAIEDAEATVAESNYREIQRDRETQLWKESVVREFGLSMSTPRCPDGISAKQVLGYNNFGTIHESQYPGGKEAWLETN